MYIEYILLCIMSLSILTFLTDILALTVYIIKIMKKLYYRLKTQDNNKKIKQWIKVTITQCIIIIMKNCLCIIFFFSQAMYLVYQIETFKCNSTPSGILEVVLKYRSFFCIHIYIYTALCVVFIQLKDNGAFRPSDQRVYQTEFNLILRRLILFFYDFYCFSSIFYLVLSVLFLFFDDYKHTAIRYSLYRWTLIIALFNQGLPSNTIYNIIVLKFVNFMKQRRGRLVHRMWCDIYEIVNKKTDSEKYLFDVLRKAGVLNVSRKVFVRELSTFPPTIWNQLFGINGNNNNIHLTGSIPEGVAISISRPEHELNIELDVMIEIMEVDYDEITSQRTAAGFVRTDKLKSFERGVYKLTQKDVINHFIETIKKNILKRKYLEDLEIYIKRNEKNSPSVTLCLEFEFKKQKIIIDIVPAIKINKIIEVDFQGHKLKEYLFAVPKIKSNQFQWRLSYSLMERSIMRCLTQEQRDLLIEMKILKQKNSILDNVKSYHLKCVLINVLLDSENKFDDINDLREAFFNFFKSSFDRRFLPLPFDRHVNVIENIDITKCKQICEAFGNIITILRDPNLFSDCEYHLLQKLAEKSHFQPLSNNQSYGGTSYWNKFWEDEMRKKKYENIAPLQAPFVIVPPPPPPPAPAPPFLYFSSNITPLSHRLQ